MSDQKFLVPPRLQELADGAYQYGEFVFSLLPGSEFTWAVVDLVDTDRWIHVDGDIGFVLRTINALRHSHGDVMVEQIRSAR